jgi:hypothetical protein
MPLKSNRKVALSEEEKNTVSIRHSARSICRKGWPARFGSKEWIFHCC